MFCSELIDTAGTELGEFLSRELVQPYVFRWVRPRVDWDTQPLGEMPDRELANALGVTRPTVRMQRLRRGIPAFVGGA